VTRLSSAQAPSFRAGLALLRLVRVDLSGAERFGDQDRQCSVQGNPHAGRELLGGLTQSGGEANRCGVFCHVFDDTANASDGRVMRMLVRYRYRLYPTPGQAQQLARTFGCARWVFNQCLHIRTGARAAGEKVSDTEVQRRAVTLSKQDPDTAWLAEVASVALVQACQDARRAYRNWFDSLSGKRRGRKVGHPRFRRRQGRQSIRLTRNGFSFHGSKLYVAKVGDLRVEWSRGLPSVPSSCTVIREADGRFYASFVVDRPETPLPPVDRTAGIDLGLTTFATIAYSDGTVVKVDNPRHLRAAERRLKRAQQNLARKERGSQNRAKARVKVAVLHRKVRETRADHHHKLALTLIRENQAVAVEDLAVSGLARTRLAKSIHDAGWAQFVACLGEKASQYGRQVIKIGRFEPTSQVCSTCGIKDGPKPLSVRHWTCPHCNTRHDRDANAARNVLLAAGLADSNACGAQVRPGLVPAPRRETGTHRSPA
jgi:putative transposase